MFLTYPPVKLIPIIGFKHLMISSAGNVYCYMLMAAYLLLYKEECVLKSKIVKHFSSELGKADHQHNDCQL